MKNYYNFFSVKISEKINKKYLTVSRFYVKIVCETYFLF